MQETSQNLRPVLITGGTGFIGSNLAHRILASGRRVRILDNLSRAGVERNLRWLQETHGANLEIEVADLRNAPAVRSAVRGAGEVYHFAAQVAVTTSMEFPAGDFEVNARGTLNVLEALRECEPGIPLLFASTNKVYGSLEDLDLRVNDTRYEPASLVPREMGVGEERPLEFRTPYGCSKGAAEQYVLDYARTYGLPTAVFRMSCIYGPRQLGTEDQGWVAHFLIRALEDRPLTIYGDGRQVRDLLYIDDLLDAFLLARKEIGSLSGRAFNIGGGPANTLSLLELLALIEDLRGEMPPVEWSDWRPGDQKYYVSDSGRFGQATGWAPQVGVRQGIRRLYNWLCAERAVHGGVRRAA